MMSTEKKARKSANYILEIEDCFVDDDGEDVNFWRQAKDGFASPEKALLYAETEKICGSMRVIRVAVGFLFGGTEPVYTLKKKSVDRVKKTRKTKTDRNEGKNEEKTTDEEIKIEKNLNSEQLIFSLKAGEGQKSESIQVGKSEVVIHGDYDDPDDII